MKDAAPRIFRSLEKPAGRDGFDTIVAAAAAAYGSLRAPSERQAQDLGRLVAPVWHRVSAETRRNLAAALSHTPRVPRVLVDLLVASPVEISAPFLVSSPALSPDDLAALAEGADPRAQRILAGRTARADALREATDAPAPTETANAAPSCSSPVRAAPEAPAPQSPEAPAVAEAPAAALPPLGRSPSLAADFLAVTPLFGTRPAETSAAGVRETLKRLVAPGRRPGREAPDGRPTLATLIDTAMRRDERAFYLALSHILALSSKRLGEIAAERGGERLAVALKALKAPPADALSILMMMKPEIGLDVAAFERMASYYRALKPEDCRALLQASASAHRPAEIEAAPHRAGPDRAERRDFGRRKARPADKRQQSGS